MGHSVSVTACGNGATNHKSRYKSSILGENDIEAQHSIDHNPSHRDSKPHKSHKYTKHTHDTGLHSDDAIATPIITGKRHIKYRERRETKAITIDSDPLQSFIQSKGDDIDDDDDEETTRSRAIGLTRKQYEKYKKYRKLRSKYVRMEELIENLVSLNPKNLEHILMLRKTDNIDIGAFYQYMSHNSHLPQLKRVSESLSFYAVSFKPICNARKLWHTLLQDRCHKHVILNENVVRLWIAQLLSALSFLHQHNIVHLDISPQSILISDDNELILSGFDTCMLVNDHITYSVSAPLLKCCWQLPPTIRRRNDFNGFELKSFDAWSCGVLTFLLLTAKFPFFKDAHHKRIPEAQYVRNEERLSHSARDFISKLLCSSMTNRLSVDSALQHAWIQHKLKSARMIHLDGSIYDSMYTHHEHKLKRKYHILAQETKKKHLFKTDQSKLYHKIKRLNKKIRKYQQTMAQAKVDYSSASASASLSASVSSSSSDEAIKKPKACTTARVINIHKKNSKRKRTHSDSLRHSKHHNNSKSRKRRNRANSQHTYSEYRATHPMNTIDVEKWQNTAAKSIGDDNALILSPLMDMSYTQEAHDTYPSTTHTEMEHKQSAVLKHPTYAHARHHTHFIRSNHQLTPTKREPIYSRGSGQQTNVTTPNPTSSSTNNRLSPNQYQNSNNNNEDRFRYNRVKHEHKTSLGNLIAIERSMEPKEATHAHSHLHLPTINQCTAFDIDMLTADDIDIAPIKPQPRKPLLPPKIIKLESPSQTMNGNVSSSSSAASQNNSRGFQITRRGVSPSNKGHNNNNNKKQKAAALAQEEEKSHKIMDYISCDMVSREHPINEYDPLDLNDSALHKATNCTHATIATRTPSISAPQHTYAVLSEENLSLHDQHLSSKHANKSGVNLMALGSSNSNDIDTLHQNIVRNEDNASNSKAAAVDIAIELKRSTSAMDIVRAHKTHNANANAKFVEYLAHPHAHAQPQENEAMDGTPRSSVMSLENILRERGLFKKERIKQTRDVLLDNNTFDPRLVLNNPAIQMRCDMKKKKRKSHSIVLIDSVTPSVTEAEHSDIHYNIQKHAQMRQKRSQTQLSDIIHPAAMYKAHSVPITSPSPLIAANHSNYAHYSFGTSRCRTRVNADNDSRASISALSSSPNGNVNNNNNNNNSVNSRNRNNNAHLRSISREEDENEDANAMYDGRTCTY